MAKYIYKCEDCKHETEASHLMNSPITVCCSRCGSDRTHRVPQVFNAVYAVPGFYHIDSGKRFESQLSERAKKRWQKQKSEAGV